MPEGFAGAFALPLLLFFVLFFFGSFFTAASAPE
jgi:hypothetical protein